MAREGTTAAYNPLATTLNYGSNTKFNSVGVRNYADQATGVEATARTLEGGYPHIVADLKAGDGAKAAVEAGELSKWSGGGYTSISIGGATSTSSSPGTEPAALIGGGLGGLITGGAIPGVLGGLFGDVTTGWVQDIAKVMAPILLDVVFSVAAFAFITLGVARLTGHNAGDVFNKVAGTVGTAKNAAMLAAV
jgi:hypothetical protein